MTLKTQISADVAGVFLNTTDFAESVTYFAGGAAYSTTGTPATAVFDRKLGDPAEDLQGNSRHVDNGKAIRRHAEIEIAASVGVSDTRDPPDLIKASDGTWVVFRILGVDADMVTVLGVQYDKVVERHNYKRSG